MRIAILTGGETGERGVSIASAQHVQEVVDFVDTEIITIPQDLEAFKMKARTFDLVIPMIHGKGGEDGFIQDICTEFGVPFIFSVPEVHRLAIDKQATKDFLIKIGIRSPESRTQAPFFAKPRFGGSSIASMICETDQDFVELSDQNPDIEFIKEQPIKGREFSVGVLEYRGETAALPVVEIIPKGAFFDFTSKYDPDRLATEVCPAQIDDALCETLQAQALAIHRAMQVRHVSRSDFIVTAEGDVYFLEINTIPGMTSTSLVPKMMRCAGISESELFRQWCRADLIS